MTRSAEQNYRHVKQSGGRGQFAHLVLRLEECEGFEFVNRITGGAIPREYFPAIEAGIKQGLEEGILKGYPVVNVRAILLDGSFHEVDSSNGFVRADGYKNA
jgi:elongation factor G